MLEKWRHHCKCKQNQHAAFLKALICAIACGLRGLQAKAWVCVADRTSGTEGNCCPNMLPAHP